MTDLPTSIPDQLTADEARSLTDQIAATTDQLWLLLERAHTGRADRVLGYASWADYVETEFKMSRQNSYQLLAQAEVIKAVSEASGTATGAHDISTRKASKLKGVLPEVTQTLKDRTKGKHEDTRQRIAAEVVNAAVREVDSPKAATPVLSHLDGLEKLLGKNVGTLVEQAGFDRARKIGKLLHRFEIDWQTALRGSLAEKTAEPSAEVATNFKKGN